MKPERLAQGTENPHNPAAEPTLDEQIIAAALRRKPKRVTLQTDDKGYVIIDKDLHPDIYDWAVNG
jgi:hypothetical protein